MLKQVLPQMCDLHYRLRSFWESRSGQSTSFQLSTPVSWLQHVHLSEQWGPLGDVVCGSVSILCHSSWCFSKCPPSPLWILFWPLFYTIFESVLLFWPKKKKIVDTTVTSGQENLTPALAENILSFTCSLLSFKGISPRMWQLMIYRTRTQMGR